jgi:tetratricopeptide (TPR) repeat protein
VLAGIGLAEAMAAAGNGKEARSAYDALLQEAPPDLLADTRARLLTSSAALAIDRFERERAFAESAAAIALCRTACGERMRIEAVLSRGNVLFGFQDDEGAITELEHALAMQKHFHGGPHVAIAATEQLLSRAHRRLGHLDQAEHLARDALSIVEASVPDPHSRRSDALDTVWQVLIDENKFDEAEAFGRRVIAMDEATLGPTHPAVATSHSTLGYTYLKRDKFVEASNEYRAALAIAEKVPDNVRRSAVYRSQLGVSLGAGWVRDIINATIGAVIILVILSLIRR